MSKKTCVVCGKEFEAERANTVVCSEECKKKRKSQQCVSYIQSKYNSDEEYRNSRKQSMAESNRRRRAERKELVMQRLAEDLLNADSIEEVRELLEKNTKLNAELYVKAL